MKISFVKRAVAGALVGGSLLLAAPSIAAADTLVHEGTTARGTHRYVNVQTGVRFESSRFLGYTYETNCR